MDYIPHTESQIKEMLKVIGVSSLQELFSEIDPSFFSGSFLLPEAKSEFQVIDYFKQNAAKNKTGLINFSGGGFYDHYIPAVVDKLSGRSEFYTPYTPYQPECSQGTLQAIYEYQTLICQITGMEAANASVYDGATALSEAIIMAIRLTGRKKIIIDKAVNPIYQEVAKTYVNPDFYQLVSVDCIDFVAGQKEIESLLDDDTAAVVLQNPNFFGIVQDYSSLTQKIRQAKAVSIFSVYPLSLGLFKPPGLMGADIVTGEAQCFGNKLNFGGPFLGFIATLAKYARQLPGRIAGATSDLEGKPGFVLTLQAREQHIRRQKATSNICTNQNLCAIRALIYLVCLGKEGFRELALINYHKAQFARQVLAEIPGVKINSGQTVFNEFVVETKKDAQEVYNQALSQGIIAGIPLASFYPEMKNKLLISVTEKITKKNILQLKSCWEKILD